MDIQYYITFREVARCLNLTRAAERLGYAQPSISVQIQKLEKHYQLKLFERSGKKMQLSSDGLKLLQYADRIVEAYMESEACFAAPEKTNITIGTIESLAAYYLPPYFQSFRHAYPDINVTILPSHKNEIIQKVKKGEIDLGVILDQPFMDPEIHTTLIREEELIVICPPDHPLQARKELAIRDLNHSALILTENGCTYRMALESSLKDAQVLYQIVSQLGSIEAIKQCVIIGMGAALIPRIAAREELDKGVLHGIRLRDDRFPAFYSQIIIHKNIFLSEPLKYLTSLFHTSGQDSSSFVAAPCNSFVK
ncbi:LysR family transcriptional regulator [Paenibacillus sedimenti]|uniref:LysR family transcriptional regulator n=1 Tax=Paenibacillus sedimenti TaxID=2770274 RepID=A0A926KXC5_9BACL|nr:LysR family transcriptional regulator [Paenibacillus sedimenti]MBD0383690.1 LysR family transcriptional regulator [Paenibacillus sedimenti]